MQPRKSDFTPAVAVLTGGGDKPYALGLAAALIEQGIPFDFIGSDEVDAPELHTSPLVSFRNLRGSQRRDVSRLSKAWRVIRYYLRLVAYAFSSRADIFHILWNNKWETFDRVVLTLFYRLLGKRVILTIHNVNAGRRDGNDSWFNQLTLRIQYRLAHHCFVHTEKMKGELERDFNVPADSVSVIPFGINNTVPSTGLTSAAAKERLGLDPAKGVILFFGNIAPYKGLEYLIQALPIARRSKIDCQLVVAGAVKGCEDYWARLQIAMRECEGGEAILQKIGYIPDDEVEIYFKAADVLVLPYTEIFQSGVLFLGYSFGLPVIATDVGALREEIIENVTGFVCPPRNPEALARAIEDYFDGRLYRDLEEHRCAIKEHANERYSWRTVGEITRNVYASVTHRVRKPGASGIAGSPSAASAEGP